VRPVMNGDERRSGPRGIALLGTSLVLLIAVHLRSSPLVFAASGAELRSSAASIASQIQSDRAAGRFDLQRQQKAIQQLGQLTLSYIELVDDASFGAGDSGEKAGLRQTGNAIAQPLQAIYDGKAGDLEKLSQKVIDEDGDLDALYASPEWRQESVIGSQALYYLNWLNFYGARVSDGAEKKKMLEKAVAGFSEFAVGDGTTDLFIESVLGRGLANLELGETADGERDLRYVLDAKEAAPDKKQKAQIALVDAYLRNNQVQKAIDGSKGFGSAGGENASALKYLRIRALVLGAKQPGAAGDKYRQEAISLMEQLRRQGGTWAQRVDAVLAAASSEDPAKWAAAGGGSFATWQLARTAVAKGDCKQAVPLLQDMLKSEDADVKPRRGDAGYLLAVCQFQAGQQAEAAATLAAAMPNVGKEYQADAAYLYFKAAEARAAKEATPEVTEELRRAAGEYVQKYPDHKAAYEAYLRLGEILQGERKFPEAIAMYEKVQGDPMFELRARFATLQSKFEQTGELPKNDRAQRDALLKEIGTRLPQVTQQAREIEKKGGDAGAQAHEILGKTAVLEAAYLAFDPGGDPVKNDERILVVLKDFETTYPNRSELFAPALKFRLETYARLDRLQDAEADLRRHSASLAGPDYQEARDQLAQRYARASGRARGKQDEAGAKAAQQVAVTLFEMSDAQGNVDAKKRLTLARLYLETGETAKAKQTFEEILAADPTSLVAMKSLARLAESSKDPNALQLWQRYASATKPGDAPWYDGQYEVARFVLAGGDAKRACEILTQVKSAIMGLGDADLRKKLGELYTQACG